MGAAFREHFLPAWPMDRRTALSLCWVLSATSGCRGQRLCFAPWGQDREHGVRGKGPRDVEGQAGAQGGGHL